MTGGRLDAALHYVALGWSLLPLNTASKHPHSTLLPRDETGKPTWKPLTFRPASRPEVRDWFDQDPECNIGVLTGAASGGLVVADFDRRAPALQITPMVETARGLHAYYRSQLAAKTRRFAWGELRGDGSYVVAPPSIHPDGHLYRWFDGLAPWDAELRALPTYERWLSQRGNAPAEVSQQIFESAGYGGDSLSEARKIVSCFGGHPAQDATGRTRLLQLASSPEVALQVARFCGCNVDRLEQNMLCPLPGHDERHPSAALWHAPGKPVRLHCFHGDEWWYLPDLFAAVTTGKPETLSKGVRAAWWLRALHESGIVVASRLPCPQIPREAPALARKVYEGFCYLLQLRKLYDGHQRATPFSWRFAAHWCGIGSPSSVQQAMQWLLGRRYLLKVTEGVCGLRGRAAEFELSGSEVNLVDSVSSPQEASRCIECT